MDQQHAAVIQKVVRRFSQLPKIQAVAVAGSQVAGTTNKDSDIDIYIYSITEIPSKLRTAIGAEFSDDVEINDFWGPGNEWTDRETGIHVDAVFWTTGWIKEQVERVLVRHEASMGYTTCFWHTVRNSQREFDRNNWLSELQKQAMQDYPEPLVKAIVANNYPVLRQTASSYLKQLEKAAYRADVVSLNHRTAALFASYFDILFAINRVTHPGEKRLIEHAENFCPKRPSAMRAEIHAVLEASVCKSTGIGTAINRLIDSLDEMLESEGL